MTPTPSPSPADIITHISPEISLIELASKHGVAIVMCVVFVVFFIWVFKWLMTKIDTKMDSIQSSVNGVIANQETFTSTIKSISEDGTSHKDCTKDNFYTLKSQHEKFATSIESFDDDVKKILDYLNDIVQENKITSDKVKYIMDNILKLYERCAGGRGKDE
jgi:uncharacterized protein YoxC